MAFITKLILNGRGECVFNKRYNIPLYYKYFFNPLLVIQKVIDGLFDKFPNEIGRSMYHEEACNCRDRKMHRPTLYQYLWEKFNRCSITRHFQADLIPNPTFWSLRVWKIYIKVSAPIEMSFFSFWVIRLPKTAKATKLVK